MLSRRRRSGHRRPPGSSRAGFLAERAVADQHDRRSRAAAQDRRRERERARQVAGLLAGRDGGDRAAQAASVTSASKPLSATASDANDATRARSAAASPSTIALRARPGGVEPRPRAVARRHRRGPIDQDDQAAPGAIGGRGARVDGGHQQRAQQRRAPAAATADRAGGAPSWSCGAGRPRPATAARTTRRRGAAAGAPGRAP